MVKMFAVLRRKQGISHEEFVTHWRDVHGPLIRDSALARHIVRYEQHPRHRPDGLSGNDGIDGVAVQWFRSIDDFAAFISDPLYPELVAPDELRFIDMERIEFLITEEPNVVIDGPRGDAEGGPAGTGVA